MAKLGINRYKPTCNQRNGTECLRFGMACPKGDLHNLRL